MQKPCKLHAAFLMATTLLYSDGCLSSLTLRPRSNSFSDWHSSPMREFILSQPPGYKESSPLPWHATPSCWTPLAASLKVHPGWLSPGKYNCNMMLTRLIMFCSHKLFGRANMALLPKFSHCKQTQQSLLGWMSLVAKQLQLEFGPPSTWTTDYNIE